MWSDQYKQTCRRDRLTNLDPPRLERLRKEHVKAAEIETLLATEQRLEEATAGQVDTVVDRDGRTLFLRGTHEQVLESEAAGMPYGLRIPGEDIAPSRGVRHRTACLRALATYPAEARP